jgi:hypothetical protein
MDSSQCEITAFCKGQQRLAAECRMFTSRYPIGAKAAKGHAKNLIFKKGTVK